MSRDERSQLRGGQFAVPPAEVCKLSRNSRFEDAKAESKNFRYANLFSIDRPGLIGVRLQFAISYRLCRMAQVLVQQNQWHEQIPRNVGAQTGTLTGRTSHYYEHGLPFLAIGHAFGNDPQFDQTVDVVLVLAEQGEYRVNRCVSSNHKQSPLHSPGPKKPGKRHFHTSFDGNSCPMLPVM